MEIAVTTVKQNKDSAVKQRIQDIQMLISWREIAHTYFGKSASWLYHKLDGIDGNRVSASWKFRVKTEVVVEVGTVNGKVGCTAVSSGE